MHLVRWREKSQKQEQKEPDDCWNIGPCYNRGMSTGIPSILALALLTAGLSCSLSGMY